MPSLCRATQNCFRGLIEHERLKRKFICIQRGPFRRSLKSVMLSTGCCPHLPNLHLSGGHVQSICKLRLNGRLVRSIYNLHLSNLHLSRRHVQLIYNHLSMRTQYIVATLR